jgi:competence protein ComEA
VRPTLPAPEAAEARLDAALGHPALGRVSRALAAPDPAAPRDRPAPPDPAPEPRPAPPPSQWTIINRARDVAARHAKVVALLGVLALLVTLWLVLRARPWSPVVADPAASVTVAASPPAPSPTPTPQPWRVHVLGAVNAPGLVEVAPGARVADALAAAGGLTQDADPAELNLAAELVDGAQVIIGTWAEPRGEVRTGTGATSAGTVTGTAAGGAADSLIDLNRATQAELETLPGVGPVTAQAILAWRDEHGAFTTTAELQEVSGIGPKTYAQLEPYVRV